MCKGIPAVAIAMLATFACSQPAPEVTQAGSASDAVAVRAEIDRINASIERWIAAGHVDSLGAAYAADAWAQGPNSAPSIGRDSIMTMWGGLMKMGKFRLTPRAQEVVSLGTDHAVERGTYEMSFERPRNAPAGTPPSFTDRGSYIVLWVKEGDRWLLKWDLGSSSMPMPGAK